MDGDAMARAADEREGDCQQGPGSDVVYRSAQDSGRAQRRELHTALFEDSCQYWKGRDAHGDAEEEHERKAADGLRRKPNPKWMGDRSGRNERKENAHAARQDGCGPLPNEVFVIELHPYEEEENDQPDIAEEIKRG